MRVFVLLACALLIPQVVAVPTAQPALAAPLHSASGAAGAPQLQVQGNQLVDVRSEPSQPIQLHGVNRSGTEYACIQGWGIFDGPADDASIQAIASWNTNAVRIPLNEDCWLAINHVKPDYSGRNYQQAIATYVRLLNLFGLVAILDLHWSAPGAQQATGQQPMPDRDHAMTFWRQVAAAYATNLSVVFDLFNEPSPDSGLDSSAAWHCWRYGGACSAVSFRVAGMQDLVGAVRATGARNVIMLGGVEYANAVTQWLTDEPADPAHDLAASWHVYDFNACTTVGCWNQTVAPLARQVPVVTAEFGEKTQGAQFVTRLLRWLDGLPQGASYIGWTWDAWKTWDSLIADYSGTPNPITYGVAYHDYLVCGPPLDRTVFIPIMDCAPVPLSALTI
jgi:hypothetical protein